MRPDRQPGIVPPAERMRRIREISARAHRPVDALCRAQGRMIAGIPEWRVAEWMRMGILDIPGAAQVRRYPGQSREFTRQLIAYDDWLARCTRKRRVSRQFRLIVIERAGGRCVYCGRRVRQGGFHVDHIRPVRWGGRSVLANLAASCPACNLAKGADDGWTPYGPAWVILSG